MPIDDIRRREGKQASETDIKIIDLHYIITYSLFVNASLFVNVSRLCETQPFFMKKDEIFRKS
jgi:hypothetical protein